MLSCPGHTWGAGALAGANVILQNFQFISQETLLRCAAFAFQTDPRIKVRQRRTKRDQPDTKRGAGRGRRPRAAGRRRQPWLGPPSTHSPAPAPAAVPSQCRIPALQLHAAAGQSQTPSQIRKQGGPVCRLRMWCPPLLSRCRAILDILNIRLRKRLCNQ